MLNGKTFYEGYVATSGPRRRSSDPIPRTWDQLPVEAREHYEYMAEFAQSYAAEQVKLAQIGQAGP